MMGFRLYEDLEKQIDEAVSASGLSIADWLREAVIAYLQTNSLKLEQGQLNGDGETEDVSPNGQAACGIVAEPTSGNTQAQSQTQKNRVS